MNDISSVLADLDNQLHASTPQKRIEIMRSIADVFLAAQAPLSSEQTFLFDDIIQKLTQYLEREALTELGLRIADAPNAPPQMLRRLASGNVIEVAGPILSRSERLTDANLVEIAERNSQEHLAKIAERRQLSEKITDVLVDRGDRIVLNKVSANYGARFSRLGMSTLVMRADGDDELISIIAQRSDISPSLFNQLLSYATAQTRTHLLSMRPASPDAIHAVLNRISARASATISAHGIALAQRFMGEFSKDLKVTRSSIPKFADNSQITQMIAALAVLSGVAVDLIDRLICDESAFGAMVLCKAIELDWTTAHAVLKVGPSASSRVTECEEIQDDFARLSVPAAQRLLKHWQNRSAARVS